MQVNVLDDIDGERAIGLVFAPGDELISELTRYARQNDLEASRFSAVGALEEASLGYFDRDRTYHEFVVVEPVRVLSLVGDIVLDGKYPRVHALVVLEKPDGTMCSGHLLHARVRTRMELVLIESPASGERDAIAAANVR